jgi:hypothetical protein
MKQKLPAIVAAVVFWVGVAAFLIYRLEQMRPSTGAEDFSPTSVVAPQQPVTDVTVRPVREVADLLEPSDSVLGVEIEGEARAYPLAMLNQSPERKVVNDTLAGRPIAATY